MHNITVTKHMNSVTAEENSRIGPAEYMGGSCISDKAAVSFSWTG